MVFNRKLMYAMHYARFYVGGMNKYNAWINNRCSFRIVVIVLYCVFHRKLLNVCSTSVTFTIKIFLFRVLLIEKWK